MLNGYDAVHGLLSDSRLSLDKANSTTGYQGFSLPPALDANLLNMDPPQHTRIRKLASSAFTPARVAGLAPFIKDLSSSLLDNISVNDCPDLIQDYAVPLSLGVISDLLGIPLADTTNFHSWTTTLMDGSGQGSPGTEQAARQMYVFLTELIAAKRLTPASDLISAMIEAHDESDQLTEDELLSLAFLILWAGYENSVHLIGNSVVLLLQHPEIADSIRQAGTLADALREELIRLGDANIHAIRRFPTTDVTIGKHIIPAGETVLLSIRDANRDPLRYPDPEKLDPNRVPASHLSFGHGIHYCIGATLARLELTTSITALLTRFPHLRLATPVADLPRRSSPRIHAFAALPVRTIAVVTEAEPVG